MDYCWLGKKISCAGMTVQLIEELSERFLYSLGECIIVAHGKVEETDKLVTAKLRVEYELTD
jgi:hypothetical protein